MAFGSSPGGYALSALGRVLEGTGRGVERADVLGQRDRSLDLTERAQNLATEAKTTDVAPLYQLLGLPLPAGAGRVPTAAAGDVVKLAEGRRVAQEQQAGAAEAGNIIGQQAGDDPRLQALAKILPLLSKNPQAVALAQDYLKPEKPQVVGPGGSLVGPQGQALFTGTPKTETEIRQGPDGYYAISKSDPSQPAVKVPGIGPPEGKGTYTRSDIEDQLSLEGLPPGTLQHRQRYNDLARQVPVGPGGAVFGAGTGLGAGVPASQGEPTRPLAARPITPAASEREDLATLDSAQQQLRSVIEALKRPGSLGDVMGSVIKNPVGALARVSEEYAGVGMNDDQRRMMATLAIQLQNVKHALIGATRTRPELADIAAAIPDEKSLLRGDTAQQAVPKLEALLSDLQSKRAMRESAMGSTGVAVPVRPGAPGANQNQNSPQTKGAPTAPTGNRIRVRSKADPSRMGWINAGEPIPPDVEVVR